MRLGPCGCMIAQRDLWNNCGRDALMHWGTIKMSSCLEPPRSTATKSWTIQRNGVGTVGLVHRRHFPRRGRMHDCRGYAWSDSFDFLRNELWSWKVRELCKSLELPSIRVFCVRTTTCKTGEHVLLPSLRSNFLASLIIVSLYWYHQSIIPASSNIVST